MDKTEESKLSSIKDNYYKPLSTFKISKMMGVGAYKYGLWNN